MKKSDTKGDSITNTNIKESGNDGNGKVDKPGVDTVDIFGGDAQQNFVPYIDEEGIIPKLFDMSELPEGTII